MARSRGSLEVVDSPLNSTTTSFNKKRFKISLLSFIISIIMSIFITIIIITSLYSNCILNKDQVTASSSVTTYNTDLNTFIQFPKDKINVRLPNNVIPDTYYLKIVPYFNERNFTFDGKVQIIVNVTKETNEIILHSVGLNINKDLTLVREYIENNLERKYDNDIKITKQFNDNVKQFYIIQLSDKLKIGKQYEIMLNYTGQLKDDLRGFYKSSYIYNNQTRWLATTQFQPTDARRAFPCFDEPALKAKFQISIARPSNMTSISNTRRISENKAEENLPDYVLDTYELSVPMSTYLVAFIVTDFDVQSSDSNTFNVWTRKEAVNQAAYSLKIGPKILKFYEDYFQINYPLSKIDMIALPDFSAGAMENWGLITYRETAMLYQEGVSSNSNKQRVAVVIAHELAHQWFGNLVTPSWWTDLWLNEGFASYVENIGTNAVEPEWKALDQFVVNDMQTVFSLDALMSSHPVSIPVDNPDEINEIFDRISYSKGASIIRMMDHFLTTNVFKQGLTNYLNGKKYQSAEQDDLWEYLTKQGIQEKVLTENNTVKKIMDTWTLQTGFPVVTITRNYNKDSVSITQERFMLRNNTSNNKSLWWIPLSYTTSKKSDFNNTKPSVWMKPQHSTTIHDIGIEPNEWLIFNIQETGYYRVNYDIDNWKLIIEQLRSIDYEKIGSINRAQLIDDSCNLARGGYLDYSIALNVTSYLVQEKDYIPWKAAFEAFDFLDKMLINSQGYDMFREYVLKLIDNIYKEVGFKDSPNDPHLTVLLRINLLNWACKFGHKDCVNNAIMQFNEWKNKNNPDTDNPISANLKSVVYCTAIRYGGLEDWEFAWERFLKSNVASEKDILLSSLGCTREVWLLSRYLDWSLTENSGIRKQDSVRAINAVSNSVIGQPLAFNYFISKWTYVIEYLGNSQSFINHIIKSFTSRINTKRQLMELLDFMKEHLKELNSAARTITQVVEQAQTNVQWIQNNHKTIHNWLKNLSSNK